MLSAVAQGACPALAEASVPAASVLLAVYAAIYAAISYLPLVLMPK